MVVRIILANYGDRVAGMIESALTVPDQKKEVLELCLASPSTGDFKPIDLPALQDPAEALRGRGGGAPSLTSSLTSSTTLNVRKHVPGRAGGGWDSDQEDDDDDDGAASESHSIVKEQWGRRLENLQLTTNPLSNRPTISEGNDDPCSSRCARGRHWIILLRRPLGSNIFADPFLGMAATPVTMRLTISSKNSSRPPRPTRCQTPGSSGPPLLGQHHTF